MLHGLSVGGVFKIHTQIHIVHNPGKLGRTEQHTGQRGEQTGQKRRAGRSESWGHRSERVRSLTLCHYSMNYGNETRINISLYLSCRHYYARHNVFHISNGTLVTLPWVTEFQCRACRAERGTNRAQRGGHMSEKAQSLTPWAGWIGYPHPIQTPRPKI